MNNFKNEAEYQTKIINWLKAQGFEVQIHNDVGHPYVPDLSWSGFGYEGWIEIKWLNGAPKTMGHVTHFTAGQVHWLKRHGNAGSGRCHLWVGTPWGHYVVHHRELTKEWRDMGFEDAMSYATIESPDLSTAIVKFKNLVCNT